MTVRCPECGSLVYVGYAGNSSGCVCGYNPDYSKVGAWVDPQKFYEDYHFSTRAKMFPEFLKEQGIEEEKDSY